MPSFKQGRMERTVLFATFGSLGDLHPLLAIAQEMKRRGHRVIFAVPPDNAAKIERAGFETRIVFPAIAELGPMVGGDAETITSLMIRDMDFMIRKVLLELLPDTVDRLLAAARDADAVVAPSFFAPVPIAAERLGLPLFTAVMQPLMMFSVNDAPRSPDLPMFFAGEARGPGLAWNRAMKPVVFAEMRRRYAPKVNRLRRRLGLPPTDHVPVFGVPKTARRVLGLYSPHFAPPTPGLPPRTLLTGFTWFDSGTGAADALDEEAERFIADGDAPLVFTLGSFAVHAPGDFYAASVRIARALERRAILLTGPATAPEAADDVLVRAYLPHSLVFPRAAAIVHHGGMGTTAQALRSGRPQLVVPHFGDQFDHASRLVRLGVAAMVKAPRYPAEGAGALSRLLTDAALPVRAAALALTIGAEDGGVAAADAIELALAP